MTTTTTGTSAASRSRVEIDFLFLDLEVCTRCRGTDANLDLALDRVAEVLTATGIEVVVRKTLVDTIAKAEAFRFVSSPTIRVNGRDIAFELRESRCESCESCACGGTVDCRVWIWEGREHTEAPVGMVVDAILRGVYSGTVDDATPSFPGVPENLKRFFTSKAPTAAEPCCSPETSGSCCEPSQKASCCGDPEPAACGCQ
jgi:hypothetical protein